ncbi:MAG TPA: hypothetical protein VGK31_05145 [Thermoanaerobaculia bacterium]|jgi:hypothetical protein
MIRSQGEWVTDYLRYHVLIRVFDGNAHTWLEVLQRQERVPTHETVFVQWIDDRLKSDPDLLNRLRDLVDGSGLWPSEHVDEKKEDLWTKTNDGSH